MELVTEENTAAQKLKEHVALMNTVLWRMDQGRDIMEAGMMGLTLTTGLSYPRPESASKGAKRVYDTTKNKELSMPSSEKLQPKSCMKTGNINGNNR